MGSKQLKRVKTLHKYTYNKYIINKRKSKQTGHTCRPFFRLRLPPLPDRTCFSKTISSSVLDSTGPVGARFCDLAVEKPSSPPPRDVGGARGVMRALGVVGSAPFCIPL